MLTLLFFWGGWLAYRGGVARYVDSIHMGLPMRIAIPGSIL